MTYRQALEELETILRALETDAVDVDDLTARVERSAELIRLCRRKLRHAETSLDRVFDNLDQDEDENEDEDGNEDEDNNPGHDAADADEDADDADDAAPEQAGGPGRPTSPSWLR